MKTTQIKNNRFGIISVIYGWCENRKEYFINVSKAKSDDDKGLIMAIGTLTTTIPHPDYKGKRQYKIHEMADVWFNLGIPDKDILLLLAKLPV